MLVRVSLRPRRRATANIVVQPATSAPTIQRLPRAHAAKLAQNMIGYKVTRISLEIRGGCCRRLPFLGHTTGWTIATKDARSRTNDSSAPPLKCHRAATPSR